MSVSRITSLALMLAACATIAEPMLPAGFGQTVHRPLTPQLVPVTGTRVDLPRPGGFSIAGRFPGFEDRAKGASVVVTELPGPFEKVTAGFDAAHLKQKGMELVSKQETRLAGYPAILVQVTQPAYGKVFCKWVLVFGDEHETVVVTATWPDEHSATLSDDIKNCLLNARWERSRTIDPGAGLGFTVAPAPPLKFTKRLQNTLLFTPSGRLEVKTAGNPMFVVGPSLSELEVGDHAAFSRARLEKTADVADIKIEKEQALRIGGLPAWEIVATAVEAGSRQPVYVYQVIAFAERTYYIMQGQVSRQLHANYAPAFWATARSFRLKPQD